MIATQTRPTELEMLERMLAVKDGIIVYHDEVDAAFVVSMGKNDLHARRRYSGVTLADAIRNAWEHEQP